MTPHPREQILSQGGFIRERPVDARMRRVAQGAPPIETTLRKYANILTEFRPAWLG